MSESPSVADDGMQQGSETGTLPGDERLLIVEEAPTLPVWEPTGDVAVDAALEALRSLEPSRSADHVPVFEDIHQRLRQRLTGLDAEGS